MYRYVIYFKTFRNYTYLLRVLVSKDIKRKYKGSYLGILWSLFNPLLHMILLTVIFSELFKLNIDNVPVYILAGKLIFDIFSASTTASMNSIIASAELIKKVYMPKYIITLSTIISNFVFFLISLAVLVLIMAVTRAPFTVHLLITPVYLALLFLFCCGVGLILATVTVFFRDVQHLYGVLTTLLMFASAIFYPPEIIPAPYQFVLEFNPVFYFVEGFRHVVHGGMPAEPANLLICAGLAVASLVAGVLTFEKNQYKFISSSLGAVA